MNHFAVSVHKLNPDTAIFNYNSPGSQSYYWLIVDRTWSQSHTLQIRQFFISNDQSVEHPIAGLEKTMADLKNCDRALGFISRPGTVFAAVRGFGEVWLTRDGRISKLLQNHSKTTLSISGWIKPGDLISGLLGVQSEPILTRQLQLLNKDNILGSIDIFPQSFSGGLLLWPVSEADKKAQSLNQQANQSFESLNKLTSHYNALQAKLDHVKNVGFQFYENISERFSLLANWLVNKLPGDKAIYAVEAQVIHNTKQQHHRRLLLILAVLMLVGLTVSIGYGIQQRRRVAWQQRFGQVLNEANHKLSEGQQLAQLNPARARELVSEAGQLLQTLEQRGLASEQLQNLRAQMGQVLGLASGKRNVKLETWLSLDLIRSDLQGTDLANFGNSLVVLDTANERVVNLGLTDKSSKVLAGKEQLNDSFQVAIYGELVYVLTSQGIMKISQTKVEKAIDTDAEWGKVADLQVFAGNLYLLSQSGLWKYPITETGFGSKQPWLSDEDVKVDRAVKISIDGFIWTAEAQQIRKFAQGRPDQFETTNLPDSFKDIKALFTDDSIAWLYILEPAQKRIVVIEKATGQYKQQYVAEELTNAVDLVVAQGQLFVLVGNKILSLEVE